MYSDGGKLSMPKITATRVLFILAILLMIGAIVATVFHFMGYLQGDNKWASSWVLAIAGFVALVAAMMSDSYSIHK